MSLDCDPRNDYFQVLQGHNWNSWMARPEEHTVAESYERRPASSLADLRPRVPCNPYWRSGPGACSAGFRGGGSQHSEGWLFGGGDEELEVEEAAAMSMMSDDSAAAGMEEEDPGTNGNGR